MTAQINLTKINENTKEVFSCDLKIKLKEYKFDSTGEFSLKFKENNSFVITNENLSELENKLNESTLQDLLIKISEFLLVKWNLCKQGKEKLDSNLEFLIKDITNL